MTSKNIKQRDKLADFGLCTESYNEKKWNGVWVVDEEFIKLYIENYSVEEFFKLYKYYIVSYFNMAFEDGYKGTLYADSRMGNLIQHINETTDAIYSLNEVFEIVQINPSEDTPINKTQETQTITGRFNEGADNHIVSRSTTLTTETIYYEGYKLTHSYGHRYSEGEYRWVNGVFHDVPAHFYSVNEWTLDIDDGGWYVFNGGSIDSISCKWLVLGSDKYYERVIYGYDSPYDKAYDTLGDANGMVHFPQPVRILTEDKYDVDEHWLDE